METLQELGLALGFATLSGLNLYLTVFVTSLALRMNWLDLAVQHESLAVLSDPLVLAVSGTLFVIEFFADKIPWVDSFWDVGHTVVRPVGGVLLALAALGEMDPALGVVAGLLSGGATLATHAMKAGSRLLINLSPEPFTNTAASVAEDGLVLGGLSLMALQPAAAFFVFLVFCVLAIVVVTKLGSTIRRGLSVLKTRWFSKRSAMTTTER